jgi:hypothetical protein
VAFSGNWEITTTCPGTDTLQAAKIQDAGGHVSGSSPNPEAFDTLKHNCLFVQLSNELCCSASIYGHDSYLALHHLTVVNPAVAVTVSLLLLLFTELYFP